MEEVDNSKSNFGVWHTRVASCGDISDLNAHPHLDTQSKIAVFHAGYINNQEELKMELVKKGVILKSDTDTEIISHLIALELNHLGESSENVSQAISNIVEQKLLGTWGLTVMTTHKPGSLFFTKNAGNYIFHKEDRDLYITSECSMFEESKGKEMVVDNNVLYELESNGNILETYLTKKF